MDTRNVQGVKTRTYNIEGVGSFHCVQVAPGEWCWTTPGFAWKFSEKVSPPNHNVALQMEGKYYFQLRVKSIEVALVYSQGFSFGYKNGVAHGREDAEKAAAEVKEAFQHVKEQPTDRPPPRSDEGIVGNDPLP